MKYFGLIFFICLTVSGFSQETEDKLEFGSTDNTSKTPKYSTKNKEAKSGKVRYIITKSSKKVLSGNKCYSDYTINKGFRYIPPTRGNKIHENSLHRFMHNVGVKTMLTLKLGPFWALSTNKKRKNCIRLMHDYPG